MKFSPTLYDSIIVGKFLSINPVFVVFYSDARQNVFFQKIPVKVKSGFSLLSNKLKGEWYYL